MKNIHVVVGIILRDGFILIAKRPGDKHQGNLWEFPGGKLLDKEDPEDALIRELKEEVGIDVINTRPLIEFTYEYPDRSIILDARIINEWKGEVNGCEHQQVRWVKTGELEEYTMPPANKIIIDAIKLPTLYLVCPKPYISDKDYLNKLEICLSTGVKLLQLRCGDEYLDAHHDFIIKLIEMSNHHGAKILLNTTPEKASLFNAHGVHLNSNRLMRLDKRPFDHSKLVAASCHDESELKHACDIGADFLVLSPVLKTQSHPDSKTLGWKRFSILTKKTNVPVFALGGMQCGHMKLAWEHGAHGIAIQSHIWQAQKTADKVRECLENY